MKTVVISEVPPVRRGKRGDELFTRVTASVVREMRAMKRDGASLSEISDALGVAKSTASVYCRDLFDHPSRVYLTEDDYRDAVLQRGLGKDHCKYRSCVGCGRKIRNEHTRCAACNLVYQMETGEVERFVAAGEAARFQCDPLIDTLESVVDVDLTTQPRLVYLVDR